MPESVTKSRGESTRAALLDAAIVVFGRDGFDAASTRRIANVAGANQAAIGYHFGGKEALYLAAFESIAGHIALEVEPMLGAMAPDLAELEATAAGHRAPLAVKCIERVFSVFVHMFGQATASGWVRLVMREQQDPTAAFEILYNGPMGNVMALLTRLVADARDMPIARPACKMEALMLWGQLLVFMAARTAALRHMGWEELGHREIAAITSELHNNLHRQFAAELQL